MYFLSSTIQIYRVILSKNSEFLNFLTSWSKWPTQHTKFLLSTDWTYYCHNFLLFLQKFLKQFRLLTENTLFNSFYMSCHIRVLEHIFFEVAWTLPNSLLWTAVVSEWLESYWNQQPLSLLNEHSTIYTNGKIH